MTDDTLMKSLRVPEIMEGETRGLVPVVLNQGEKLYVARADFQDTH